jgi:N-acetylmuramoyl-L-alanine amidase
MQPDSPLVREVRPSPNTSARRNGHRVPDMVVLHYTGMATAQAALDLLCDPASNVSAHYVVLEDGAIIQSVPEALRAWHAGVSSWQGASDINSRSIGIEIVNGGHDFGLPPFPDGQIAAVIALLADILARHAIAPSGVVGHSDIAPLRKRDPGEAFPWAKLVAAGVAVAGPSTSLEAAPQDGADLLALQDRLWRDGYMIPVHGRLDDQTRAVLDALSRRRERTPVPWNGA